MFPTGAEDGGSIIRWTDVFFFPTVDFGVLGVFGDLKSPLAYFCFDFFLRGDLRADIFGAVRSISPVVVDFSEPFTFFFEGLEVLKPESSGMFIVRFPWMKILREAVKTKTKSDILLHIFE
jgi:hypothetical protein